MSILSDFIISVTPAGLTDKPKRKQGTAKPSHSRLAVKEVALLYYAGTNGLLYTLIDTAVQPCRGYVPIQQQLIFHDHNSSSVCENTEYLI